MQNIELVIEKAAELIKGKRILPIDMEKRLVSDYGFESLEIIDLFFEIQRICKIEIDLSELALSLSAKPGRTFSDLTFSEIKHYLENKSNK